METLGEPAKSMLYWKFARTMPFSGSSGSYRDEAVYGKGEAELAKHGVVRGWKQCRDKLKALKKKYNEVGDGLHRSGVGVELDNDTI